MKRYVFFFAFISIFILSSCAGSEGDSKDELASKPLKMDLEQQHQLQNSLLLNLRQSLPKDFGPEVKITESRIEKENDIYYLKTFYDNGYLTTTLLRHKGDENSEDPDETLVDAGVSCTSSVCTSGSGCTPTILGDCTSCRKDGTNYCTRTASLP